MEQLKQYLDSNKERFLDELKELLKIPSVSADPAFSEDVKRAAEWLEGEYKKIGLENVEVMPTPGHPIVYGEKIIDPNLPTVLVYGHYDVQPPDPIELWDSPPFEPVVKDGNIVARGACDDKGQAYMHIKALEMMHHNGGFPCNVKVLIEGEEEVGSVNLEAFLKENKEKLACDVVMVSDTSMISLETPSITVGLRGLSYLEVEVIGPNRDLHSGVYGGAVANPINVLSKMISDLIDDKGRITIPEFYDDVVELSSDERAAMAKAPFDEIAYKSDLEVDDVAGEEGYSITERTSIRPTLDVNGIWGGYIGEGAKTVLPSKAEAKISMRLVPNQSDAKITELFTKHFESIAPKSVKVKVTPHHGGEPAVTPIDSKAYLAASKAIEKTFAKTPIPARGGGSIPIVALFEDILDAKTVLMGFGLDSDKIHSPNEQFGLENFYKGIETIPWFYYYLVNE